MTSADPGGATADQVMEIRSLHGVMSQEKIARKFCIDRSNVGLIVNRKAWKHVD